MRLSALFLLPAVASAFNLRGSRRLQMLEERAATIEVDCDEGPPIPAILTEPHCLPSLLEMPLLTPTGDSQKDMEAYMDLICVPGCAEAWDEYIATTLAYTNKCQTTMMYAQQLGHDADLIFVDDPAVAVIEYEDEDEEAHGYYSEGEQSSSELSDSEHSDSDHSDSELSDSEQSDDEGEVMAGHEEEEEKEKEKEKEEEATSMLSDGEESHSDSEEEKEHEEEEKNAVDAQSDDEHDGESDVEEEAHFDDESAGKTLESDDEESDNEEEDSHLTEDEALELEVNQALESSFAPMSLSLRHKYFRVLHTMRSTLQDFLESEGIDYDMSVVHRQDERGANSNMFLGFMLGCQRDPVDNQYCATKPFSFEPRRCDIFESCCWGEMVNKVDHDMNEDYSPFEEVCPGVVDHATKRC